MKQNSKISGKSEIKVSSKNNKVLPGKANSIFYLILVLIPILFFVLLEIGLRIFNYGIDMEQWISMPGNKLMLNPEIARRYFYNTNNVPYSNEDLFDKIKAKNSFRIFVLGESSAAGYPYLPIGAFSRYLQKKLELLYPNSKIEVVNISMTAINTYAIRDMFPEVLEQKSDLVLIYTGHNEYYGALGVGSNESLGSSPKFINTILYLNRFKTVELLRNLIFSVSKMFSGNKSSTDGTLMSRIVKDQYIQLNSKQYNDGVNQFESNLKDILSMAKIKNVPVILGTLTSNLKDQRPFISIKENGRPGAKELYDKAKEELRNGNSNLAAELFRKAKDLDCLRFRASEDVNKIIRQLGKQFINPVVDIDSVFNASSPDGIVGDNLMVDHLHPTLSGYKLISSLYYNQMKKSHLLPKSSPLEIKEMQLDSLVNISYKTTRLDSIIAINRIKVLKNDWPYIDKKDKKPLEQIIERKDYIDSLALDVIYNDVTWEKAHRLAAQWYLKKNNIPEFQNYMDVLIEQYPIIVEYYDFIANKFIEMKMYDIAYNYLLKGFEIKRNAYFAKWLGIIDLSKMKTDRAINYLNLSLKYDARDPQVLYNLAGAYVYKNDYNKALDIINRCLEFNPNFPDAGSLKNQLVKALSK